MAQERYNIHPDIERAAQARWTARDIEATRQLVNRPSAENSGVIPILTKLRLADGVSELKQIFVRVPGRPAELFTEDQIKTAFLDPATSTLIVFTNQRPRRRRIRWDEKNPAFYVVTYLNPQSNKMTIIDDEAVTEEI